MYCFDTKETETMFILKRTFLVFSVIFMLILINFFIMDWLMINISYHNLISKHYKHDIVIERL